MGNKNIAILGASGFIGKYLFENLNGEYDVHGYTSKTCDLLNEKTVKSKLEYLTEDDAIVFSSSITRQIEDSVESFLKNVQMANNVCNFLEEKKVNQVIFLSTAEVYGEIEEGEVDEDTKLNPTNYYSISKVTSEQLLNKTCKEKGIPLSILRLPGVYGPGDEGISVINKLVTSAKNGKVNIISDSKRDFVHVNDVKNIVDYIIEHNNYYTMNVATGKSYRISKVVDMIKENLNIEFEIEKQWKSGFDLLFHTFYLQNSIPNLKMTNLKNGIKKYLEVENNGLK